MPHEDSVTVERYGIVTCARTRVPVVIALSLAVVSAAIALCVQPAGAAPFVYQGF